MAKTEKIAELKKLVGEYVEAKRKEAEITKVTKDLNARIKKIMVAEEIDECEDAKLSVRRSESFDEEKLIDYLKTSGNSRGLVKKKEYIDYDALESAIYREKLDAETIKKLDDYKIVKETKVLTIK